MYENTKIYFIESEEMLDRLIDFSNRTKSEFISFDVETNTAIARKADLYGIGLCFNTKHAFYIPWRNQQGEELWTSELKNKFLLWLDEQFKTKKMIAHNGVFDILVMKYVTGYDWTHHIYADTILMKHTIEEEPPHGLKPTAVKYLGPEADKAQDELKNSVKEHGGKWTKDQKDMYLADTKILGNYCCWDVLLTFDLFRIFSQKLKEEDLEKLFYEDEIMELYRWCTIPMKDNGFPVDIPYYENLKQELGDKLDELEETVVNELLPYAKQTFQKLIDRNIALTFKGDLIKQYAEKKQIPLPVTKQGNITLSKAALTKQAKAAPEFQKFYETILNPPESSMEEDEYKEYKKELDQLKTEKKEKGIDTRTDPELKKKNQQLKLLEYEKNLKLRQQAYEYFDPEIVDEIQRDLFKAKKKQKYLININSGDQLSLLFFEGLEFTAKKFSEKTGKPSVDSNLLDELIEQKLSTHPFLQNLYDYRKLLKLYSTYVIGILDRQIDGIIYTDMLQFGTTSGRYSSRDPNLQNQPRIKDEESGLSEIVLKYVNAIRGGFCAPKGKKITNADYSQLEPCCFAHMSGDPKLQNVFHNGEDLYARVSIDVFGLHQFSANKKADNYLKKKSPETRAKAKVFTLAVPYGAEEGRIAEAMSVDWKEAGEIIRSYLDAYPNLKKFMQESNKQAMTLGYVKTDFGRIRHLAEAKELYRTYSKRLLDRRWAKQNNLVKKRLRLKNLLNNSTNVRIQGLAAHIVNRAMIATAKRFKEENINGYVALQVHDEITCIVAEEQAEQSAKILQECMENTTTISVPLIAEPLIADRWSEAK